MRKPIVSVLETKDICHGRTTVMAGRVGMIQRTTRETSIELRLDLDGSGKAEIETGIGFLDHMLDLFTRHAAVDLKVVCRGDRHIDDHHSAEDIGICLGQALEQALGDKAGIQRYGHMILPMDETLVTCALDLSGRPFVVWNVAFPTAKIGTFDTELVEEFWRAFVNNGKLNYHVILHHGQNSHHISEAIFKASARALRTACTADPRMTGIPSTKGALS